MQFELLIGFLVASIALTVMPGPDNIYVLTQSITKSQKTGIAISFGLVSGVWVHTLAAATGLSLILKQSETVFQIVKYFGVAYLLFLTYQAWNDKSQTLELNSEKTESQSFNFRKLARKGFLMNVLNPKVSLFFIVFLPQFVSKDGFSPMIQMLILGVIFMLQAFLIFSAIAMASGFFSKYLSKPKTWKIKRIVNVVVLLGLAIGLVFS